MAMPTLNDAYDLLEVESDDFYLNIVMFPQMDLWDLRFLFNVTMRYRDTDASFQWHSEYLSGPREIEDNIATIVWHAWISMFYLKIRKYIREINGAT